MGLSKGLNWFAIIALGVLIVVGGVYAWFTSGPSVTASSAASLNAAQFVGLYNPERLDRGRTRMMIEDPRIMRRIIGEETFGGKSSTAASMHMFADWPEAVADVAKKTDVVEVAPGTWIVRFPIVNAVFFETDAGVVLVDAGMGPAGPALLDSIRSVTDKPIAALIYTHGHVDHMYGASVFLDGNDTPARIIAHRNLPARVDRYIKLSGSLAKYMSQPIDELPKSRDDLLMPTELFDDRMEINVGGETIVLQHHRAETDDQLYVWAPQRKMLVSADYYMGFLPNLGNGKRVLRYGSDWIAALREMANLGAEILLPMHGDILRGAEKISAEFELLAAAIEHVEQQVVAGLNAGLRSDEVVASIDWPARFSEAPTLDSYYVNPQDVAKMYLKEWTGWWDDQPAHWTPATLEAQSRTIVELAGGIESFLEAAKVSAESDIVIACHMADWAFFAHPDNPEVQNFVIDVYKERLLDPETPIQETIMYFDHIALVRGLMLEADE